LENSTLLSTLGIFIYKASKDDNSYYYG